MCARKQQKFPPHVYSKKWIGDSAVTMNFCCLFYKKLMLIVMVTSTELKPGEANPQIQSNGLPFL